MYMFSKLSLYAWVKQHFYVTHEKVNVSKQMNVLETSVKEQTFVMSGFPLAVSDAVSGAQSGQVT
jgi:hypothetical protein